MKADNTAHLIGKLRGQINQFIILELKKEGIDGIVPSHGDIIVSLLKKEAMTMRELADKIEKDPSTITTLVKKLNHLGYTQVVKDNRDKRANRVLLTSKGKNLEEIFFAVSEKLYSKQFENIDEKEQIIFREVLIKMIENFKR